jgi:hypothetical protein
LVRIKYLCRLVKTFDLTSGLVTFLLRVELPADDDGCSKDVDRPTPNGFLERSDRTAALGALAFGTANVSVTLDPPTNDLSALTAGFIIPVPLGLPCNPVGLLILFPMFPKASLDFWVTAPLPLDAFSFTLFAPFAFN